MRRCDPGGNGQQVRLTDLIERSQPATVPAPELPVGARRLSDADLVAEVLRKDRRATAEFVARCADGVYAYVRRRLIPRTDAVEDLVQEVFLAAWESLERFRGDSSLQSWMLGIARNKVEDYYRKQLREVPADEETQEAIPDTSGGVDLEAVLTQQQLEARSQAVLASMDKTYSTVLLWRYWEQRTLRDMAVLTGKTEKAIERLLARARNQFKKRWNERPESGR